MRAFCFLRSTAERRDREATLLIPVRDAGAGSVPRRPRARPPLAAWRTVSNLESREASLEMRDFSGSDRLMLKQETIAKMIGTRRNSVSQAASALQQAKCISYSRGVIEITSPEGLSKKSCECYARLRLSIGAC